MGQGLGQVTSTADTALPYAAKAYKCAVDFGVVMDKSERFTEKFKAVCNIIGRLRKATETQKDMDKTLSGKVEEMENSLDYLQQIIEHSRKSGLQSEPQDVEKLDKIYAKLKPALLELYENHQEIDNKQKHGYQKRTLRKWTTTEQMQKDMQSITGKIKEAVQKTIELTIMLSSKAVAKLEILQLYNTNKKWPIKNSTVTPPKAPQLFIVESKGNSFKMSWQSNDDTTTDYYELCYDDDQCSPIILQGTTCKIEISPPQVAPGRIYVMKIRGINLGGAGEWSDKVVGQLTKPPPRKPDPPKVHAVDVSHVVITVTAPTPSCESESPVTQWNVEYVIDSPNEKWSCENYKVKSGLKQQMLTVRNLSPKIRYYFRVQAINVEGKSDFSRLTVIKTAEPVLMCQL